MHFQQQNFRLLLLLCLICRYISASPFPQGSPNASSISSSLEEVFRRDDAPPSTPERPSDIAKTSFHGSQFAFFDKIGFVAGSPGVEAAPVFLYSRTEKIYDPCYPESAIVIGSKPPRPNPGTDTKKGTMSANPGADCTNPGPYHGGKWLIPADFITGWTHRLFQRFSQIIALSRKVFC